MLNRSRLHATLMLGGLALSMIASPVFAQKADLGLEEIVVTATKRQTNLQETPVAISVMDSKFVADRHIQSLLNLGDGAIPSLRVATFEARQSALTVGIRGIVPFDQNQTARDAGVGVYIDGVYLGRSQGLNAALFDVERIEVLRGPQGSLFGRNTEGGAVSIVTKEPTGEFDGKVNAGFGNYGSYEGQAHVNLPSYSNLSIKLDGVTQKQDATTKNPMEGEYGWNYFDRIGGRMSALWEPTDNFSALLAFDKATDKNTPFYSQLINYNPNGLPVGVYNGTVSSSNVPSLVAPTGSACPCIAPLSPLVFVSGNKRMDSATVGVPQDASVDKTYGFSGTLKYQFADDVELRSITAWRGVDTMQWDNSGGPERTPAFVPGIGTSTAGVPNGLFSRYSLSKLTQDQFSQEFQIVGSVPMFDYVLGVYYFKEDAFEKAATPSTNRWNANGTGYTILSAYAGDGALGPYSATPPNQIIPVNSAYNQGWAEEDWLLGRRSWATTKSYAGFANATWHVTDVLHLTVGARYTKDKRDFFADVVNGVYVPERNIKFNKGTIDPAVTLAWDATDDVNLYGKFSTGYRAGGVNSRSSGTLAFGPEKVKAYEIGAKTDFFDDRVRLNLAGYIMDRTNTQVDFDYVDNTARAGLHTQETLNIADTSKLKGVEAELTVQATDYLTLGASYAYTKVHIPDAPNPLHFTNNGPITVGTTPLCTSFSGATLTANAGTCDRFGFITPVFVVFTPKNAYSVFADYEVAAGFAGDGANFRIHLDTNYAGEQYSFQDESVLTESSLIVNGNITLADIPVSANQTMTLSLWSRNLLDEDHIYRRSNANNATLGAYGNFNAPRTFGATASFDF